MAIVIFATLLGFLALSTNCGVARGATYPPITAITNAKVRNGTGLGQKETTVVLAGGIISNAPAIGATIVDARGGYLLPGFIDAHYHVQDCSDLTLLRQYGVTTALDMGTFPYSSVTACRAPGVTSVYGPGAAGTVNGTTISHLPGFPPDSFIPTVEAGIRFVTDCIEQGADYIKIFLDLSGPNDQVLTAVVEYAHSFGKQVIIYAPSCGDYSWAEVSGADLPCHVPLDKPLDSLSIANLTKARNHVTPTLTMMQSIVNNTGAPYFLYANHAEASVTNMYSTKLAFLFLLALM
jgi:hypothetical protein